MKPCRVKTRPTGSGGFCGSGFIPTRCGKLKRNVGLKPDPRGAVWVGLQSDNEFQKNCRVKTRPTGSGGFCGSGFIPTRSGKLKRNVGLKPDPQGQRGSDCSPDTVREGLLAAAPAIGCCAVTCRRRQSDNELQKNCRVKTRPTEGSGFCGSGFIPTRSGKLKRNVGLKPDPQETRPHDKTMCCNSATHPPNALTPHRPLG